MVGSNSTEPIFRRSVSKRTAGALTAGSSGLTASGDVIARQANELASGDRHTGVTCGTDHSEGTTFTVEPRCDADCDVIRLNGLAPSCVGEREEAYADLPGTDPTVWMNIRNGRVPPRTYRVVRAERCEPAADECDGRDLYRLEFRPNSE
jgi:hypothetical protein